MEHEQDLRDLLVLSAQEIGITLTESQVAQFMCYLSQLTEWNESINLTGITGSEDIVIKHFIDSLTAVTAQTIPQNARLIDIGTGAGFPGIPLKIVRNDLTLVLIEPSHKKCSFLASVVGLLKLRGVNIFQGTVKAYCDRNQPPADVVTIRALRFDEIKGYVHRLIASAGRIILYRTTRLRPDELNKEFLLQAEMPLSLPRKSGERIISVLMRSKP